MLSIVPQLYSKNNGQHTTLASYKLYIVYTEHLTEYPIGINSGGLLYVVEALQCSQVGKCSISNSAVFLRSNGRCIANVFRSENRHCSLS